MKFRKLFLKPLAVFMAVCMSVGMVSAASNDFRTSRPTIEIIFVDDISREKAQLISDVINGEELISPRSILCIFGHSLAQTRALGIEHRVWSTSPRCRQTIYDVTYCTRSNCNHIVYTVRSQTAVSCC